MGVDYKTTGRAIDLEKYAESWQWRAYLAILPSLQEFRYDVFHVKPSANNEKVATVFEHRTFRVSRYPTLMTDVIRELCEYVDFPVGDRKRWSH